VAVNLKIFVMENTSHTFESVWATMQENNRFLTEKFAESERLRRENERLLNEKFAETERILRESRAETDRQIEKVSKQIAKTDKMMGGISNNNGLFAEEYFFNSFEAGNQNFFGEKFDKIMKNKGGVEIDDEYDILLINGQAVGIVETKYKAHENDIPKIVQKAETFRINFPKYENHRVYLGLASMSFYPKLEEECKKQGIAIIKQVGDKVVIYDENLKVF